MQNSQHDSLLPPVCRLVKRIKHPRKVLQRPCLRQPHGENPFVNCFVLGTLTSGALLSESGNLVVGMEVEALGR